MTMCFHAYNVTKTRNAKSVRVYAPTPRKAAQAVMDAAAKVGARVSRIHIQEGDFTRGEGGRFDSFSYAMFGPERKWTVAPGEIGALPECEAVEYDKAPGASRRSLADS